MEHQPPIPPDSTTYPSPTGAVRPTGLTSPVAWTGSADSNAESDQSPPWHDSTPHVCMALRDLERDAMSYGWGFAVTDAGLTMTHPVTRIDVNTPASEFVRHPRWMANQIRGLMKISKRDLDADPAPSPADGADAAADASDTSTSAGSKRRAEFRIEGRGHAAGPWTSSFSQQAIWERSG